MDLAFYAPMKSPDHPTPSGDRTIGRGILAALAFAGHSVAHVSKLRIYDKSGDREAQKALFAAAQTEVARVLALPDAAEWRAWVTYHNYYKAPDLIGPPVCQSLGIPYILVEATRARKRLTGPWAHFAQAAEAACDAAHTVFYFTQQDAEALERDAPAGQTLVHLPPFLPRVALPIESARNGVCLVVGMMRPGDKLASYALIAEAFAMLDLSDWQCDVIGDGPARPDVENLFQRFGDRVRFHGALTPEGVLARYQDASVLFWPGVNEAFGMTYLEAQAAGLPVVAQDRAGVKDVVQGPRVALEGGSAGLAARMKKVLSDSSLRKAEGRENRQRVLDRHLLPAAAARLDATLGQF